MLEKKATVPRRRSSAQGFTLIETLVAIVLLGVGVMGLAALIPFATRNDYRSRLDTTATFLAMREMEQIMAQPFTATSFTDAADGNTAAPSAGYCENAASAGAGLGTRCTVRLSDTNLTDTVGTGAQLVNGMINFSQAAGDAALTGYRRTYTIAVSGDANAPKVNYGTYELRWNVYETANGIKTFVIAARPVADSPGITLFPAHLRAVQMK